MNAIVHGIRNRLAVAVASVEAFIDEKLEPTPHRLRSVSEALGAIDELLVDLAKSQLRADPDEAEVVEICTIIGNEVIAIERADPAYRIDSERRGHVVKALLLNAIRHTAPGGTIVVECRRADDRFECSVSNEPSHVDPIWSRIGGGTISIVSRPGNGATFTVRLLGARAASEHAVAGLVRPLATLTRSS